jgi:alkanesulfonate monooxygenase SsuD/methylene tetrahydromethanopterin reductase-like flavin-dependent oxidoreductase (luciferase family)
VLDYISIDDTLAGNPPFSGRRRTGLDSVKLATRLAPATEGVRLVPQVAANRVKPSTLLEALIELEVASEGRHGWELQLHDHPAPMTHSGELLTAIVEDTWSAGEPLTQLAASARAFRHRRLDASIHRTQPARQPVAVMRADSPQMAELAAWRAHVARISATDRETALSRRADLRDAAERAGRDPDSLKVLVDVTVTLSRAPSHAEARKELAEEMIGEPLGGHSARFVGTPEGLADWCIEWVMTDSCDGFTFLPTSVPVDLMMLVDGVMPVLALAGYVPSVYQRPTRHATGRAVPVPRRRTNPAAGSEARPVHENAAERP